jgi:hypothetical protein
MYVTFIIYHHTTMENKSPPPKKDKAGNTEEKELKEEIRKIIEWDFPNGDWTNTAEKILQLLKATKGRESSEQHEGKWLRKFEKQIEESQIVIVSQDVDTRWDDNFERLDRRAKNDLWKSSIDRRIRIPVKVGSVLHDNTITLNKISGPLVRHGHFSEIKEEYRDQFLADTVTAIEPLINNVLNKEDANTNSPVKICIVGKGERYKSFSDRLKVHFATLIRNGKIEIVE